MQKRLYRLDDILNDTAIPDAGGNVALAEIKTGIKEMVADARQLQPPDKQPRTYFPKVPADARPIFD